MTLTTPMKIVLAVIIIAVIGLGFWILDWQGKQTTLAGIDKQLEEKNAERERIEADVAKIDELVTKNNELKRQLEEVVKAGFKPEDPKDFVPNYLEKVEALVARIRQEDNDETFDITAITPGALQSGGAPAPAGGAKDDKGKDKGAAPAPIPALQNYPTRTFQMSMKGKYNTLVDFLDRLGALELQRLVTVNKLALAPVSSDNPADPTLAITMPMTAYLTGGGEQ